MYEQSKQGEQEQEMRPVESEPENFARIKELLSEAEARYRENPQKGNIGIAYLTNKWEVGFMPAQIAEVTDTEAVLVGGGTFSLAYVEEVEFVDAEENLSDGQ